MPNKKQKTESEFSIGHLAFSIENSIHRQKWPSFDLSAIKEESVVVAVQVNGKLRDTLTVSPNQSKNQKEIEGFAKASERVKRHLADKNIKKIIFVSGRLINFVV